MKFGGEENVSGRLLIVVVIIESIESIEYLRGSRTTKESLDRSNQDYSHFRKMFYFLFISRNFLFFLIGIFANFPCFRTILSN